MTYNPAYHIIIVTNEPLPTCRFCEGTDSYRGYDCPCHEIQRQPWVREMQEVFESKII